MLMRRRRAQRVARVESGPRTKSQYVCDEALRRTPSVRGMQNVLRPDERGQRHGARVSVPAGIASHGPCIGGFHMLKGAMDRDQDYKKHLGVLVAFWAQPRGDDSDQARLSVIARECRKREYSCATRAARGQTPQRQQLRVCAVARLEGRPVLTVEAATGFVIEFLLVFYRE